MTTKTLHDEVFAFWIESKDNSESSLDIHINEWFSPKKQSYLDIGLRIYHANSINKIGIFIPFNIKLDEIIDLYEMIKDGDIARIIFNSDCNVKFSTDKPISEIEYNNRHESLVELNSLSAATKNIPLNPDEPASGTIVYLHIDKAQDEYLVDELYVRFRVPHKSIKKLFYAKLNLFTCITSPEHKFEYNYVLRVNEARTPNKEIRTLINKHKTKINKIILSASIPQKFDICDDRCFRIRTLEKLLRTNYVPKDFDADNTMSYQWKWESSKDTGYFYNNIKIRKNSISFMSVIVYLFLAILLSTICSAISQNICDGSIWEYIIGILNNNIN